MSAIVLKKTFQCPRDNLIHCSHIYSVHKVRNHVCLVDWCFALIYTSTCAGRQRFGRCQRMPSKLKHLVLCQTADATLFKRYSREAEARKVNRMLSIN